MLAGMEKEDGDYSPNTITYTSIFQSCCEKGKLTETLKILDRMRAFRCVLNPDVIISVLTKGFYTHGREGYRG